VTHRGPFQPPPCWDSVVFGRASSPQAWARYHQTLTQSNCLQGEVDPYHQLLDGWVLLRLPARGRLLVDDLHADVVLGRDHAFQIWAQSETETGSVAGDRGASSATRPIAGVIPRGHANPSPPRSSDCGSDSPRGRAA